MTERNESQQAAFDAGHEAINFFMEKTHEASYHKDMVDGMVEALMCNHRTIQQESVKFFVQMLQVWGRYSESQVSDMRNAETYRFAQKLINDSPCFPFI